MKNKRYSYFTEWSNAQQRPSRPVHGYKVVTDLPVKEIETSEIEK